MRLTRDTESTQLGKFRIVDTPKGFDFGIREYIKLIFGAVAKSSNPQDLLWRFCTYNEFEQIHDQTYSQNPIFKYFLIDNELERQQFCNNYPKDYKGYLTAFQAIQHPLEKLFFFVDRCKSSLFHYSYLHCRSKRKR